MFLKLLKIIWNYIIGFECYFLLCVIYVFYKRVNIKLLFLLMYNNVLISLIYL